MYTCLYEFSLRHDWKEMRKKIASENVDENSKTTTYKASLLHFQINFLQKKLFANKLVANKHHLAINVFL